MNYKDEYKRWLSEPSIDAQTKAELEAISQNEPEIEDRFYTALAFGTAGLRGVLGAGTNRMNVYVVRRTTQGLCNYIKRLGKETMEAGVVIAYDSRHMSAEFAAECASVLAANGVKAYLFESLRPTPVLSFAVRELHAAAGINITASHNPPEYNGYKVYWSDGGQMPPHAVENVVAEIEKIGYFDAKLADHTAQGLITKIGGEIDEKYLSRVLEQSESRELVEKISDDFRVVYTPIHGSGNLPVRNILKMLGVKNLFLVEEQLEPDGDFPTVKYPNPENKDCFDLAIEIAKRENADLIIGTDPDCDRVGVVMRDHSGEYIVLNGNEIGVILLDYLLSRKKEKGTLPENGAVVKSIVTTDMARDICDAYGVTLFDVLTGFKYIGEKILQFEQSGEYTYLFGFEESFGYLAGTYARDKDAVVASMLICEACAYYKANGMTFYDGLMSLYEKYGTYQTVVRAITLAGMDGMEKIKTIMASLRKEPIDSVAGGKCIAVSDYLSGEKRSVSGGPTEPIDLPSADVLSFEFEGGVKVIVRPSGTEPKIKVYYFVKADCMDAAKQRMEQAIADVTERLSKF